MIIELNFEASTTKILLHLAHKENKSMEILVKDLIIKALEYREDQVLLKISEARDVPNARRVTHHQFWKDN